MYMFLFCYCKKLIDLKMAKHGRNMSSSSY